MVHGLVNTIIGEAGGRVLLKNLWVFTVFANFRVLEVLYCLAFDL
jgi:hypothetical protein